MTGLVLVINAGSSSLRYAVLEPQSGRAVFEGYQHDIGHGGPPDHEAAVHLALDELRNDGQLGDTASLVAVGHRVVHGGSRFHDPVLIDDAVLSQIEALTPLAPLHNPGSLAGIAAARAAFPNTPQVAVFDTAFHHTLPAPAHTYAVPRVWRDDYAVRRYGFHGISFAFVARRAAQLLDKPLTDANLILLHLGNGASVCAVRDGRSVDTSMGLSPLEGLVMGTRSGDVDPCLGPYLSRVAALDSEHYEDALNHDSGLMGLSGTSDMKELEKRRAGGDVDAALAFDVMAYRLRKYIGAYAVVLGRVDAIAFTGGVGEHSDALRAAVLDDLAILGVELDAMINRQPTSPERCITTPMSAIPAYVIPTNEELEIARSCARVLASA
ncbi:MAG TPA: acetate kinase [Pedococcus sp.]|nr:acetate kinase [Pedococcus sp.]